MPYRLLFNEVALKTLRCTGYLGDLFYNLPLHVDEQHGGHSGGSLAELISQKPLRDDSHASASDLSVLQALETVEIVREATLARTDAARSQRMLHQEDGFCAWEAAQRGVLRGSATFPCFPEGRRMTFVHPISASPSRLAPVGGPDAFHVCGTLLWYTSSVPLAPGARDEPASSFACLCRRCVLSWPGG